MRLLAVLVEVSLLCLLPRLIWPLGEMGKSIWEARNLVAGTHKFQALLQGHFP